MWNGVQNSAGVLGVRADIFYTCGPVAMQSGSLHPSYPDKQLKGLRRVHSHPKATHSHADERHNDLTAGPSHYCFGSEGKQRPICGSGQGWVQMAKPLSIVPQDILGRGLPQVSVPERITGRW